MTECERLEELLAAAAVAVESESPDARAEASRALLAFQRRTADTVLARLAGAAVGALAHSIGDRAGVLDVLARCRARRARRCAGP